MQICLIRGKSFGLFDAARKKSLSLLIREGSTSALSDHLYLLLNRDKIARLSSAQVVTPSPDVKPHTGAEVKSASGPVGDEVLLK